MNPSKFLEKKDSQKTVSIKSEMKQTDSNLNVNSEKNDTESSEEEQTEETVPIKSLIKKSFFEFFATLFFSFLIQMCGIPSFFIFAFWVLIVIFGPITGGHLNPAVTFACFIHQIKKNNWKSETMKLFLYWIAQFTGAFNGAFLAFVFDKSSLVPINDSWYQVFLAEFLMTGIFCFVILNVTSNVTKLENSNNAINCSIIAATLFFVIKASSRFSSGINPAMIVAFNVLYFEKGDSPGNCLKNLGFSVLGEFAGSLIFALIFKFFVESYVRNIKDGLNSDDDSENNYEVKSC